jgi:hypothetical protein
MDLADHTFDLYPYMGGVRGSDHRRAFDPQGQRERDQEDEYRGYAR